MNAQSTLEIPLTIWRIDRENHNRFSSSLAHDMRGPLSAAKAAAELVVLKPQSRETNITLAHRVIEEVHRIDRMIRDMLDAGQLEAGQKLPLKLEDRDLKLIIDRAITDLSLL